jgi:hypothetical protein
VTGQLHHQVAREPVRALDDDRARAVGQQGLEHRRKAGTRADRVRAAHRRVVELSDDLDPGGLGVGVDRRPLPLAVSSPRTSSYLA